MKSKEILLIAITIFVTVGIVLLSDLYKASTTTQIPPEAKEFLTPIQINIDENKITQLKNR